jgi:hypothetical protein
MELSEKENLEQRLANNTARMQELVDQQFNVEITRSIQLCFSCDSDNCAKALSQALFAKGTRVLSREPEEKTDGRFHIRVGIKRSVRDAVREDFVHDLVHTASGMHGTYDGWVLLSEEPAETAQESAA